MEPESATLVSLFKGPVCKKVDSQIGPLAIYTYLILQQNIAMSIFMLMMPSCMTSDLLHKNCFINLELVLNAKKTN